MALRLTLLLTIALAFVPAAHGAKLYKWVDRDGNVSYHDRPPPSAGYRVEEKRFGAGGSVLDDSEEDGRPPVVLYSTRECAPCDTARTYLRSRGVPFTEKDVQNDANAQKELMNRAGELAVPTITVGSKVLRGYLESLLAGELDEAGYPKAGGGATGEPADAEEDDPFEEADQDEQADQADDLAPDPTS